MVVQSGYCVTLDLLNRRGLPSLSIISFVHPHADRNDCTSTQPDTWRSLPGLAKETHACVIFRKSPLRSATFSISLMCQIVPGRPQQLCKHFVRCTSAWSDHNAWTNRGPHPLRVEPTRAPARTRSTDRCIKNSGDCIFLYPEESNTPLGEITPYREVDLVTQIWR